MLTSNECLACIIDDMTEAIKHLNLSKKKSINIIHACLLYLAKSYSFDKIPSVYITNVHRIIKRITKCPIPFKELRERCNDLGIKLLKTVNRKAPKKYGYRLSHFLLKWSVAGNYLDFRTAGRGYHSSLKEIKNHLNYLVKKGFDLDQSKQIYKLLRKKQGNLLFIHDNIGEIALDIPLIRFLKGMGWNVISLVKSGAITSDAIIEDAKYVGLDKESNKLISTGTDTLGLIMSEANIETRNTFKKADFIMAKGQANYYMLSELVGSTNAPISCIFTTKCTKVSKIFKLKNRSSLAILLNNKKSREAWKG